MRGKPAYQTEPGETFRTAIWARGHVEPWELLRIVAWKSAKGLPWLAMEAPESIASTTEDVVKLLRPFQHVSAADELQRDEGVAFLDATTAALGPRTKASGLRILKGVALPVASAVLVS